MTIRLALLSCATLPAALAAAQLPGPVPREKEPPSQTRMQEQRLGLTVSGCIRGNRLLLGTLSDASAQLLNADELLLEGPKDLMQQLRKEHEGHDDELTGVAILRPAPDGSTTTNVQSKPLGKKGRITLGVRESQGPQGEVKQPVRFRVSGLRHLAEGCARVTN